MDTVKRLLALVGGITLVAMAGALLAPKAVRAVTALLVQVTNTPANPVPISDITKSPAQIVNLNCDQGSGNIAGALFCAPVDPTTAEESSPFTVPAGQHFVVTSIEINPAGSQPSVYLVELTTTNGPIIREYIAVPTGSVLQLRYTGAGLVFGPGTQFGFGGNNSTLLGLPEAQITVEGYLTAN
jgi:hypothetical protein